VKSYYRIFLFSFLIVVTNPYEGLDYDEINVYEVGYGVPASGITVHEAEDFPAEPEEEKKEEFNWDYLIFPR
jgi:hypothetical protein